MGVTLCVSQVWVLLNKEAVPPMRAQEQLGAWLHLDLMRRP